MDELRITPGKTVADIGAGSGWFTVLAARRVGAGGKVYAVDINQGYLDYIEKRSRREGLSAIQPVLGTANDPKLPATAVDAVLMLRAYHEVAEPVALLKQTRNALKPKGLLGIIDRNGRGNDHGVDQKVVVEEAAKAGFKLVDSFDFVKAGREDYFLVFQPTPEN
ncbi:MAG: methyltransferase domain-containing protein [Gemmatimonadaceae bacterium]|nr:methyltransferase domain-containing protein [Gloeobacterales cyanobacterium ES-bin-141]